MESTNATIYAAFVKAQIGFGPALKTSTNPAYRSRYADLSACIEAVIDALNENGIGLIQKTHQDDKGVTVETLFVHTSGESMSGGTLHVPAAKQDPQGYGSALTYARRYSLMAACGIAPDDDDGNAASKAPQRQQPTAQPKRVGPQEVAQLKKAIQEAGLTEAEFCGVSRVESIEAIELNRFAKAMDYLKKQAKEKAA